MIRTNNQYRPILDFSNLPESEQGEFSEIYDTSFFKYKGTYYSLSDAMYCDDSSTWEGVIGLTNTAALVVRLSDDCESVLVGLAL